MKTYKILRYYSDGRNPRVQKTGLDLRDAQAHCSRDDTSSKTHPSGQGGAKCDWFDGYTQQ